MYYTYYFLMNIYKVYIYLLTQIFIKYMHDIILKISFFRHQFSKLEYWWPFEALARNCKNTTPVWTNIKNSFVWLTGMKKLIFGYNNFFRSSYFSIHEILKKWPKSDRSQKSQYGKKIVFWCLSTMRRNFWTPFMLWPYFYDCFWKLWPVSAYSLDLFSKKFWAQIITTG